MFFVRTLFLSLVCAFFVVTPSVTWAQEAPAGYSTCLQRAWASVPSGMDRATYTESVRSRVNEVSTRLGETASPGNWQCRRLCTQTPTETSSCVTGGCPNDDRAVLCCPATIGSAPSNRCPLTSAGSQSASVSTPAASTAGSAPFSFQLPACTETGNCSLSDLINVGVRAANFLMGLGGVLFFFVFVYAGGRLIFFANDSGEVKNMKKRLTDASTGIVIMILAGAIVRFTTGALLPAGGGIDQGAASRQYAASVIQHSQPSQARQFWGNLFRRDSGNANGSGGSDVPVRQAVDNERPGVAGGGTCVCSPSGIASLLVGGASAEQRQMARSACEGEPAHGRFDEGAFSCTASASRSECDQAQAFIQGRLPSGATVSCSWTQAR